MSHVPEAVWIDLVVPGRDFVAAARQPQGRFQSSVIEIAGTAKLRIVAVPRCRQPIVEEIGIRMQHG